MRIFFEKPGEPTAEVVLPDLPGIGDTVIQSGEEWFVIGRRWDLDLDKVTIRLGGRAIWEDVSGPVADKYARGELREILLRVRRLEGGG
jgi:hypothetical protein